MSTSIEWTKGNKTSEGNPMEGRTWNPTVGCTEVSPGCTNCYAAKMAWRLMHMPTQAGIDYAGTVKKLPNKRITWTGKINLLTDRLLEPVKNLKPTTYFVDSMSDLFHEDIPFEYIDRVFKVMVQCPHHIFQILTKRPERMLEYMLDFIFEIIPKNIWLGVSVENQKAADERIPVLVKVPAAIRFLSCEPLLGPVDLKLYESAILEYKLQELANGNGRKNGIDWVICGGESGHGARPMHPDWARGLRDQCKSSGVAFFFKQWGEHYTDSFLLEEGKPHHFRMFHSKDHWIAKAQTWVRGGRCISIDGRECKIGKDFDECAYPVAIMDKVGKHAAGRMLDGQLHDEYPKTEKP